MCKSVLYRHRQQELYASFASSGAYLPVARRHGDPVLLPWGRRRNESGALPFGGWAHLDAIRIGRWDCWQPRPVRLPLCAFVETDIQGKDYWFELNSGQWIQGLVARDGKEQRVYVVTITPEMPEALHHRWPRIITA